MRERVRRPNDALRAQTKALPVALDFARRALLAHAQDPGASGKLALPLTEDYESKQALNIAQVCIGF